MADTNEKSILINKIAHIIKVNATTISFLNKLDIEEISLLNDSFQDAIFSDQAESWVRVAKVVKYFPNYMSAKVSEQVLGAYITANICYFVDMRDLIGIAKHLSTPFLAEVAENIIPSKANRIVNELPIGLVQNVTEYLMRKEQHFVVSSFIEVVERKRLMQLIDAIKSEVDLLKSAEFIRNPELLKDVFLSLSTSRQTKIIQASVRYNKEGVIIRTLEHMGANQREQVLNTFIKNNPEGAAAFVERFFR
ncbi:MAG: hypothetical protein LC105_11525 [Chitinophagales bacterium]|nr:hypothetical protein [Chitinophagales bacterium]MCZ2394479.1 hypothetical protein [Chitinophagales bacterium]